MRDVLLIAPRLEEVDTDGETICRYELPSEVRDKYFDLAYVDGPTNSSTLEELGWARDPYGTLPNSDVIHLSRLPDDIIVDQRRATVAYLVDKLPPDYLVVSDISQGFVKRVCYHTYFSRSERLLTFRPATQGIPTYRKR